MRLRSIAPAALCLIPLYGCQTLVQDDWQAQPAHPDLASYVIEVAHSELPAICGNHPGMRLHGCAKRDLVAKACLIYTGPRPAEWLLAHERKHCAGWDHGPTHAQATVVAAASR